MPPSLRRKGRPKNFDTDTTTSRIQALDRALDVMDALAEAQGLTLTELAGALNQSPATIYRVLSTLEARQIVEMDPVDQAWHMGSAAFRLGSSFLARNNVAERSRPEMHELMRLTGETSNLGIERNDEVMFVGQVETPQSIRAFFPLGTISPMHASGIGKALLSCYQPERLDRYLRDAALERFTTHSITEPEVLRADLEKVRERGWALDDEEKADGMRCVAAPITNIYGEAIAGISVSGPAMRMTNDRLAEIGQWVSDAAKRVSLSMGMAG
ncbi:HTH-type transcriptional regulator BhcR [Coralliovum pocilloporae]|uniref:HTH-type transcriptional regulator BhcR n=1 Tax=Coralliovum pocilloporae TaxID=3066369 RepID=UPI003306C922